MKLKHLYRIMPFDMKAYSKTDAKAHAIAELFESVSRHTRKLSFSNGYSPAQWSALRYFARANLSACTVTAFARAHNSTQGTATETIATLVRKGCLERHKMPGDRRIVRLELTGHGQTILQTDPLLDLIVAIGTLPEEQQRTLALGLVALNLRLAEGPDSGTR